VRSAALPLLVLSLAACGSERVQPPLGPSATPAPVMNPAPSALPAPVSGPHTVQGDVFDAHVGPIGAVDINLWVQQDRFGYSYWWANGRLMSNAAGHFDAPNIPDSHIMILAVKEGFVQPCAITADVASDRIVNIEMIATPRFDATPAPRPVAPTGPIVNGLIFESTPQGRLPVPDARVWVGNGIEVGLATTRSDRGGGIFLCNLPKDAFLYITKAGFNDVSKGPLDLSAAGTVEIEMTRR